MKDNQDDPPKPEAVQVLAEHAKLIPKFATKIGVARSDSNYIISFISELTGEQAQMVERIVMPEKLVDDLIQLLQDLKEK